MENVEFIVNQSGRNRVIKEKRKNVHAFCAAEHLKELELPPDTTGYLRVKYNPYKSKNFQLDKSGEKIYHSRIVWATDGKEIFV